MQTANICIELLTQAQDAEALTLLSFPQHPLLPAKSTLKIRRTVEGSTLYSKTKKIETFLEKAVSQKHNEITISHQFDSWQVSEKQFSVTKLYKELNLSPNNKVWAATAFWPRQVRLAKHSEFHTLCTREYTLKWNGVTCRPTCLRTWLKLEGNNITHDELVDWLLNSIVQSLPDPLACGEIFGAAAFTIDGTEAKAMPNILHNMQPWPRALPLLGRYFDTLHPILIGDKRICTNIANTIGDRVKRYAITSGSCANRLSLLYIPDEVLQATHTEMLAERFLVPKNSTTSAIKFGNPELGEFVISGGTYLTRRRYNQLVVEDRVAIDDDSDTQRLPVISIKYCDLMHIDPLDMLLYVGSKYHYPIYQAEIDHKFDALPLEMPIQQRIWEAHQDVWNNPLKMRCSEDFLHLIKSKFFASTNFAICTAN